MNKKELSNLPCTAPDWMQRKAAEYTKETFLLRRKFENISTYEIYRTWDILNGDTRAEFIIFREKDNWINYYPKEDRWTTGKFENVSISLERGNRMHHCTYYIEQYKILENLRKRQDKIGEKRLKEKKRKEKERVEAVMSKVPDLPEDFQNFIDNDLMLDANYIIYNRKKNRCQCTQCNGEYTVDWLEMRNNTKTTHRKEYQYCPECMVYMKQISEGLSRGDKRFRRGCEIMQPYENGVIVREFVAYREFENHKMHTELVELHRYITLPKQYREYECYAGKWEDRTTKNMRLYGPREGKNYSEQVKWIEKTELGWKGLGKMMINALKEQNYARGMETLVGNIVKRPYMEQMAKCGLNDLAKSQLKGEGYGYKINEKETALTKILGINKEQLRVLRTQNNRAKALEIIQDCNRYGIQVTGENMDSFVKSNPTRYQLEKFAKYELNMIKTVKYVEKQGIELHDFLDHLELMVKLRIPLKKQNIYPKDFKIVHQEEIEEDILKNSDISEKTNESFKKTYDKWEKLIKDHKVTTRSGNYQIFLPGSAADIKAEGRIQHHCVGGYAERAAKGTCLIFYVRISQEERLYTAEYTGRKLIQIRAKSNKKAEPEAEELAKQFATELAEAEKKEEKKGKR